MYNGWPNEDQIRMSINDSGVNGAGLSVDLERTPHTVPDKAETLLMKFGWVYSETCPNTKEHLFQKRPPTDAPDTVKSSWDNDLQNCHWRWYEAMAYEFGKFMSIGDDAGSSSAAGSGVGGATSSPA